MQTKDFTVTLDMMRTLPFHPFEVVEGDTGNVLHVALLNNGDPMDLNDCAIHIAFASSAGFAMQDETSGIVKAEETGAFDVTLLPTAYGAGNVSADVQIYSGDAQETLVTSTRFDFRCRKSLISGEIIRANTAYPPLVEAARIASEAAATALAAAARIDTDIGELNVQADWAEADDTLDAYIKNKPAIPSVPADVGAAAELHAARHAAGGADALSFSAILAAGKSLLIDASLPADGWGADCLNLFDEVLAQGAIDALTGADTADTTRVRGSQYIDVTAEADYTVSVAGAYAGGYAFTAFWYSADAFLSCSADTLSGLFVTAPAGATRLRIQLFQSDSGAITPEDVRFVMVNAGAAPQEWEPQARGIHIKTAVYPALAAITAVAAIEVLPALSRSVTDEQLEALTAANLMDAGQTAGGEFVLHARGDVPQVDLPVRLIIRGDFY